MKPTILFVYFFNLSIVLQAQIKTIVNNAKPLNTTSKTGTYVPLNNITYNFSNLKACREISFPANALPPRTATNAYTFYKINTDGTISNVAIQRQPLAATTDKMWEPGQTIKFGFSGGNNFVIEKVKYYAKQWELFANIKLEYVTNLKDATIRIGFIGGAGSYSAIGRDALTFSPDLITMNFGWFTTTTKEEEFRRVTLHEFGHALGFIHEHQSPAVAIPWDKEKVYAFYALPPNNWSRDKVDFNFFAKDNVTTTNYSNYDPLSIMHYPVPPEFTTNGSEIPFNTDFSATDKQYASYIYPFPPLPPNARGTLKTGDDCDEISFLVEYGVVAPGNVAFRLELGKTGSKTVTWWKQVVIPISYNREYFLQVQNHSLIASENKTVAETLIPLSEINRNKGMSFWKAKILGVHTLLNYQWNVLPAIMGGCRITMIWNKDSCL